MTDRTATRDGVALILLSLLPLLRFGLPALDGRVILLGDNLFQNFPLRVLAGQLLRDGHLPLWNSQIWSGTALLGGFNAGALYPGTLLFAFLSPAMAWACNGISAYAIGGCGFYLLLRAHRLQPLPSCLGALSGTFGGFMVAQYVHLALVQGMAFAPWVALALEKLGTQRSERLSWFVGWWILLCVCAGLTVLTGEPRAASNVASLALVYALVLWRRAPERKQLGWAIATALPVSFALGAVQLLPGLAFLGSSQRSDVDYGFFRIGASLDFFPRLIEPFYRTLHTPWNFPYWDSETWGYVGLVPVVAALTCPLWGRGAKGAPFDWLAITLTGVALICAGLTPLGTLLHHLPFYGAQRAQTRNLALVDFGLAGLLACRVQAWLDLRPLAPPHQRRLAWALVALPSLVLIWIAWIVHDVGPGHFLFLDVPRHSYSIVATLLAAAVLPAFVWFVETRRTSAARALALATFVSFDLGLALDHFSNDLASRPASTLLAPSPASDLVQHYLGEYGRFANYDLELRSREVESAQLIPDLFVPLGLHSAQGLGSIVDRGYNDATGSHLWRSFSLGALDSDVADDLNLRVMLLPKTQYQNDAIKHRKLNSFLAEPHWSRGPGIERYDVFLNNRAKGRAWLEGPGAVLGSVSVEMVDRQDHEVDRLSLSGPTTLVRSVAYGEGWGATIQRERQPPQELPAKRHGAIQALELTGEGPVTVRWHYDPPGAALGLRLSVGATVVLLGLGLAAPLAQRRRRSAPGVTKSTREIADVA